MGGGSGGERLGPVLWRDARRSARALPATKGLGGEVEQAVEGGLARRDLGGEEAGAREAVLAALHAVVLDRDADFAGAGDEPIVEHDPYGDVGGAVDGEELGFSSFEQGGGVLRSRGHEDAAPQVGDEAETRGSTPKSSGTYATWFAVIAPAEPPPMPRRRRSTRSRRALPRSQSSAVRVSSMAATIAVKTAFGGTAGESGATRGDGTGFWPTTR